MFAKVMTAAMIFTFSCGALAADLGAATFSDMSVRATPAKVTAGFFTVTAASNDTITGMTSDCCKAVELHRSERINGKMTMRRIAEFPLKKGVPTAIQPGSKGGEHLMLIGLTKPLTAGDEVNVTFTFKKAGEQTVTFPVVDAKAAAEHAH